MNHINKVGQRYLFYLPLLFVMFHCSSGTTEKEARQRLDTVTVRTIPLDESLLNAAVSTARNFYFIIDGSGSMGSEPDGDCTGDQSFDYKIDGAQWAVREFIEKVPEGVNLGLYVFDSNGQREVVPIGPETRDPFLHAIANIDAGGGTPLNEAILFGTDQLVQQFKLQLGYGEYRLVVVTDGQASAIPEAVIYAAEYGIPVYAIGLCIGDNHPLRHYAVSYRAADSFADLAQGLEETLAELPTFDATQFVNDIK